MSTLELPDIQRTTPEHPIAINCVGVKGLRYPIQLELRSGQQATAAEFSLAVSLSEHERGTHMSRFVEELSRFCSRVSAETLLAATMDLRQRLSSDSASIDVVFPFFLERRAPVSEIQALVDYQGRMNTDVGPDRSSLTLTARVPVTSLCPCSKEISDYGAHSQRGYVTIEAATTDARIHSQGGIDLTDLVSIAENAASAPIYSLLKRVDERHVTMQAFDQPAFVEDVVRAIASELSSDSRVAGFSVEVENQESIHNHAAWARIQSPQ
jgi:GTP cyclohydrolase I